MIDKLNYLVFKTKDANQVGGLYKALQLTNKFTSFKELGKQSGFLFYVPAWNTSKIDPVTGFVNLFQLKYENIILLIIILNFNLIMPTLLPKPKELESNGKYVLMEIE